MEPPGGGVNFFIPWGLLEWVLTGILTGLGAIAAWTWSLGNQVYSQSKELTSMEKDLSRLAVLVEQARKEREELRVELLEKISQLPTRVFIESQIQQITARIDGLIDAKLRPELDTLVRDGNLRSVSCTSRKQTPEALT